jgi:signal peptidase II
MTKRPHAMRRFYFAAALVVLVLDRITKWLVEERIGLHDSIPVIPGFFRLTHVQNRGAAFGLFAESPSEWKIALLVLFSLVALTIVSALLWRNSHALSMTGMALALAFNVADSAIVVGACMLVAEILFKQAPGERVAQL